MPQLRIDNRKLEFIKLVRLVYGDVEILTRPQIQELVQNHQCPDPTWLWQTKEHRVGHGVYRIPNELLNMRTQVENDLSESDKKAPTPILDNVGSIVSDDALRSGIQDLGFGVGTDRIQIDLNYMALVPPEDSLYVPFGNYFDIETITDRSRFFSYWIYGWSGNGKTVSVEQAHARLKKRLVLTPITREADEDSLLGGLRLLNGDTVPFFGPVTVAALLGVTCCLDEIDMGDEKLACLHTPLQNRPFPIKRLGKVIYPKPGFNLCATANTKGQGSEDGKYIGTNIQNEALLDRFLNTFEQKEPDMETERLILRKVLQSLGHSTPQDEQFIQRLLEWAQKVRETHDSGAITERITTRRLVGVCQSYDMYGKNRKKAIQHSIARFNDATKISFMDFYTCIDDDCNAREEEIRREAEARARGIDPETGF